MADQVPTQQVPAIPVPVLYLDLDGTVRCGKEDLETPDGKPFGRFVNGPEDVFVFPEALEMIRRWKRGGGRVVAVSNQGGIALGIVSDVMVRAAMEETDRQTGHLFDKIAWCAHHPDSKIAEMTRCWCRKPKPGLIIEAANDMCLIYEGEYYPPYLGLMVGDRHEDREAAELAGLDFQWAHEWRAMAALVTP